MPIHDWSKVPAGRYHHFHQRWAGTLCDHLNDEQLPEDFFALVEQAGIGFVPDVLTLKQHSQTSRGGRSGGVATALSPPNARFVSTAGENALYARRANRVVVRNSGDQIVAVIEIVSPGNKDRKASLTAFVEKTVDFIARGVSVLFVDPFPPTPRDPEGLHAMIWGELTDDQFTLPPDKRLTVASYQAYPPVTAYVEPVAVGDDLPKMALFLNDALHVLVDLEKTYMATWDHCPRHFKEDVLSAIRGALHDEE